MNLEQYEPPLVHDPMVEEANIWDLSWGKILGDKVLAHYLWYLTKFSPEGSLIKSHGQWIDGLFPELVRAGKIPSPWVWKDLVADASNIGDADKARSICEEWITSGESVAYWTGGLEFTRSHYDVAKFLLGKGKKIVMGMEPFCYPNEVNKGRVAIVDHIVPVSFWSKTLSENGFVFMIPRPLPEDSSRWDGFYRDLYLRITGGNAEIVVSESGPHMKEKLVRGRCVVVPHFDYPSTTELWNSYLFGQGHG